MRLCLVIPTHTTRHLAATLAALSRQTRPPDAVCLTCDTDLPAIAQVFDETMSKVQSIWSTLPVCRSATPRLILHTYRPHQAAPRLNQVRNNALRALDQTLKLQPEDLIVVLDGDTLLAEDALAQHANAAEQGYECIIPYRTNLDEERTKPLTAEAIFKRTEPLTNLLTQEDQAKLKVRQRRYERQLRLKRLPLVSHLIKPHKPKLLGGHHALAVRLLRAVNAYDEHFPGLGLDDDDLAKRLHLLTPRPKTLIAVDTIHAFHLYHPVRGVWKPQDSPSYARFQTKLTSPEAQHGWRNPLPQPTPIVRALSSPKQHHTNIPSCPTAV